MAAITAGMAHARPDFRRHCAELAPNGTRGHALCCGAAPGRPTVQTRVRRIRGRRPARSAIRSTQLPAVASRAKTIGCPRPHRHQWESVRPRPICPCLDKRRARGPHLLPMASLSRTLAWLGCQETQSFHPAIFPYCLAPVLSPRRAVLAWLYPDYQPFVHPVAAAARQQLGILRWGGQRAGQARRRPRARQEQQDPKRIS